MFSKVIMIQKVYYCIRTESSSVKQNRYRDSHQNPLQGETAKQKKHWTQERHIEDTYP